MNYLSQELLVSAILYAAISLVLILNRILSRAMSWNDALFY